MTQDSKYIFVTEDDAVFVSPNSSTLPHIPRMQDSIPEYTLPLDTRSLSWSDNAYPQRAFVLRSDQYTGPIFQRLSFATMHSLPMERDGYSWRLSRETQIQWARLETGLRVVISCLIRESPALLPLDFTPFRLPSEYGWGNTSTNERRARKLAMRSRDAFNPLMALCSFAISLHRHLDLDSSTENPKWAQCLIEKACVHPQWVRSLQESPVADFLPGQRVGVIVHMDRCQWLSQIPAMIQANVPIWLYWGHANSIFSPFHRITPIYRPPPDAIEAGRRRRDVIEMQQAEPALPVSHPEPERHSGQKRGETWQQFFARREESNAKRIAQENEVERQRHQNHEREAQGHPPPGCHGPVVFQWQDVDGFRIRT